MKWSTFSRGTATAKHLTFLVAVLMVLSATSGGAASSKVAVVPKWSCFEQSFKSGVLYSNPVQDVTVKVSFTSPGGESTEIEGFWDGGKVWRVRFSPDQPGRWKFKTSCSDAANRGLNQSGEFICSAPTGTGRFAQHGPVGVARDHRHFEHSDRTPFFWLADSVLNGALLSEPAEWQLYANVRASQQFTVAEWEIAPAAGNKKQAAYTRDGDFRLNADFFKGLDAKVQTLSRAGLLSAIVPLPVQAELSPDEAALVLRYVVARYGAEAVAWVIALDGATDSKFVAQWKELGEKAFGRGRHAPVMASVSDNISLLDQFRDQSWVDAFAVRFVADATDGGLKKLMVATTNMPTVTGRPPASLAPGWLKDPPRPIIPVLPVENALGPESKKRLTADDVRKAGYWSLMMGIPCGVNYEAQGVANWDGTVEASPSGGIQDLPAWHKALFMPGAKQLKVIVNFGNSIDFWRLRPQPRLVAEQPGNAASKRFIAAAATEDKTLSVVYVPEDRTVEILLEALPASPNVAWLNPRTGESSPAVAVVGGQTCQFPTPDPGDWLLVMKAGK
jgi:hypothetical protein